MDKKTLKLKDIGCVIEIDNDLIKTYPMFITGEADYDDEMILSPEQIAQYDYEFLLYLKKSLLRSLEIRVNESEPTYDVLHDLILANIKLKETFENK